MTSLEVGAPGNLRPVPYSGQIIFTTSGTGHEPRHKRYGTQYTINGYEAFYGPVAVNKAAGTFVVTVESLSAIDPAEEDARSGRLRQDSLSPARRQRPPDADHTKSRKGSIPHALHQKHRTARSHQHPPRQASGGINRFRGLVHHVPCQCRAGPPRV